MCHQNCHRHLLSTPDETLHAQRNARRCSHARATSRRGHRRCSRCCAAASQRPAKRSALLPPHAGDIGAADATAPLRLNAAKRAALQPRVRRRHLTTGTSALQPLLRRFVSMPGETPPELQPRVRRRHLRPGDIGAAAAATPLRLYAQRNARRCSRARVAATNA
jgi:hypothetical protein